MVRWDRAISVYSDTYQVRRPCGDYVIFTHSNTYMLMWLKVLALNGVLFVRIGRVFAVVAVAAWPDRVSAHRPRYAGRGSGDADAQ